LFRIPKSSDIRRSLENVLGKFQKFGPSKNTLSNAQNTDGDITKCNACKGQKIVFKQKKKKPTSFVLDIDY